MKIRNPFAHQQAAERRVKQGVTYTAAMVILLAFLVSEPARLFFNSAFGLNLAFNEGWASTLTNLALLGAGVLLGKHDERIAQAPEVLMPDCPTDKAR